MGSVTGGAAPFVWSGRSGGHRPTSSPGPARIQGKRCRPADDPDGRGRRPCPPGTGPGGGICRLRVGRRLYRFYAGRRRTGVERVSPPPQFVSVFSIRQLCNAAADRHRRVLCRSSCSGAARCGGQRLGGGAALVDGELRPLAERLAEKGGPLPVLGFELTDAAGAVIAEAELGWPELRIAMLRKDQRGFLSMFTSGAWRAFMAAEVTEPEKLFE